MELTKRERERERERERGQKRRVKQNVSIRNTANVLHNVSIQYLYRCYDNSKDESQDSHKRKMQGLDLREEK